MEKVIAISICFIMATFASCTAGITYHDNLTMTKMVASGANPIAVRCAVKGSSERSDCAIYIAINNLDKKTTPKH